MYFTIHVTINDIDNQKSIHDMIKDLTTMMTTSLLSISAIWVSFILENISFFFFFFLIAYKTSMNV